MSRRNDHRVSGGSIIRHLGRGLQAIGLLIPPLAIILELGGMVGLGRSMLIALGGCLIFYSGAYLLTDASDP